MGEQMNRRELREQILCISGEFNQEVIWLEQCTLFLEDGDTEISRKVAASVPNENYERTAD